MLSKSGNFPPNFCLINLKFYHNLFFFQVFQSALKKDSLELQSLFLYTKFESFGCPQS